MEPCRRESFSDFTRRFSSCCSPGLLGSSSSPSVPDTTNNKRPTNQKEKIAAVKQVSFQQSLKPYRFSETPSLPGVIDCKFPLEPDQKYNITQYNELFHSSLRSKTIRPPILTTSITHFSLEVGRMFFLNLGVNG